MDNLPQEHSNCDLFINVGKTVSRDKDHGVRFSNTVKVIEFLFFFIACVRVMHVCLQR